MKKIFNQIYTVFLVIVFMLVLGVITCANTTTMGLIQSIASQEKSKSNSDNSGMDSNNIEEEIQTEKESHIQRIEVFFVNLDYSPKHCYYNFTYINDFKPEVISPPPNLNI